MRALGLLQESVSELAPIVTVLTLLGNNLMTEDNVILWLRKGFAWKAGCKEFLINKSVSFPCGLTGISAKHESSDFLTKNDSTLI